MSKNKGESLNEYAARVAADAPPLSPAIRDRLAVLLRPAGGGGRDG